MLCSEGASLDLVTVVVPHYNNSRYLLRCLVSIKKQDYSSVEIVVVDDGSLDVEREAAQSITEEFGGVFVCNDRNRGVSYTRNHGLSIASGDYLTTIDPDDYYLSLDYISNAVSVLNGSDNVIWGGRAVYVDEAENLISKELSKRVVVGDVKADFFARSSYIPINIVYSREVLEANGGYDIGLTVYEDWDFKLRLCCDNFFSISDSEIAYRIHESGLSTMSRLRKVTSLFQVFSKNAHRLSSREWGYVIYQLCLSIPHKLCNLVFMKKF